MNDDFELIGKFCRDGDGAAFAELVDRHLDLVYSVAHRQVGGNEAWARDVCQEVFTSLAGEAEGLSDGVIVSGWLYRAARFAALNVLRTERRREIREQEAQFMGEVDRLDEVEDWEEVRPVLDEAISELKELDRAAVCLRFYEKLSFSEIGERLSLGENAARMRVSRALDKLNGVLSKKGIRSTSMALGVALGGQCAMTAPIGLSVSIVNGVGAGAVVAGGSVLGTLITIMSTSKVSLVGLSLVASFVVGTVFYEQGRLEAVQLEVDALGTKADGAGDLDGELAALGEQFRGLKSKRAELEKAAMQNPDEEGPHGFTFLEMEEAMDEWVGRVTQVVQFVEENEHLRISEMDLLESNDWLEAVEEGEVETVADYRLMLAKVRGKAKVKVSSLLRAALAKYLEESDGEFPLVDSELYAYIDEPFDLKILDRYEVGKWGDFDSRSREPELGAIYESSLVDPIWGDQMWLTSKWHSGLSYEPGGMKWGAARDAFVSFKEDTGRDPVSTEELRPYVKRKINEEYFEEIFTALTTQVKMESQK